MTVADEKQNISVTRHPIVVVMGHINHGKSSLLDFIRKTNVVEKEAGGITQHIGAYEVSRAGKEDDGERKITFLDTPGHEAFIGIRERGAGVADLAVLVVSAEDGVKEQTLEALRHLHEKKLPFVVALNKIDKPEANVERTKQNLAEHGVYLEGYGGDIPAVPISAKTGEGVPNLLDMILLVAEMEGLKANPKEKAEGFIIETNLDHRRGLAATLIVKNGTLKKGEYVVAGDAFAPTRIMENGSGKSVTEAPPGSPVRITGWNKAPDAGKSFKVVGTKIDAEASASAASLKKNEQRQKKNNANVKREDSKDGKAFFPIIAKADTAGSLEAIEHELQKIAEATLPIRIIQKGIGTIGEADIKTACGSGGTIVVGFNVKTDPGAKRFAEQHKIQVSTFDVIYKLIEWIVSEARKRIPKTEVAEVTGTARVLKVFSRVKDKQIIGGRVENGVIKLGGEFKLIRRSEAIATGKIRNLEQQKTKVDEVKKDTEFGALVESKMEIVPGDRIEVFIIMME